KTQVVEEEHKSVPKRSEAEETNTVTFLLEDMDEDVTTAKLLEEEILRRWPRLVSQAKTNVLTKHLVVKYYRTGGDLCCENATVRDIYHFLLNDMAYEEVVVLDSLMKERDEFRASQRREADKMYRKLKISCIFSIPIFILDMILPMVSMEVHEALLERPVFAQRPHLNWLGLVLLFLSIPVQFYVGKFFYKSAWVAFKHKRSNMSTLIAVGTTTAWVYGFIAVLFGFLSTAKDFPMKGGEQFFETATTIITIVWLGKWLQARAKGKTCEAIAKMMDLQESNAELLTIDQSGDVVGDAQLVSTELIIVGDIIKVRRGQRIPLDGYTSFEFFFFFFF
ncbi:copper-transporting atpase p-type, partial [Reticulomyxa filosa]